MRIGVELRLLHRRKTLTMNICPSCNRRVFSNGGHQNGCLLDSTIQFGEVPGFSDDSDDSDPRFVSVWDEVTYYTDDREGDR